MGSWPERSWLSTRAHETIFAAPEAEQLDVILNCLDLHTQRLSHNLLYCGSVLTAKEITDSVQRTLWI